jgi:hypothetical protein
MTNKGRMGESESVFATQSHAIQAFTTRRCACDATQALAADFNARQLDLFRPEVEWDDDF